MLLRLNKYNVQLEYVPGKKLVITGALSRAQSTTDNFDEALFPWRQLNVEEYVSKCKICQKYQRENQKDILIYPEIPGIPWQKVPYDFFCLKGKQHLLMIDYLSKYVELKPLSSTTAQSVIIVMKFIYATQGIPEDLKREEICMLYCLTTGYNQQRTFNELLMGKLRTFLPLHPGQLKPTFDVERAREALRKRQIIQNKYANKHATVLPVLFQNAKVWLKSKMKEP
ncbi:retrovirus-related Pol polyprotein from transposon 17.6 [Trichonephila clavata]|uniref:Retrovirus-related Pol polyprotein from transposon 17.6 n=1 Tax=Trichonephila clavata TaxID=2740835 RepID=A0A8X6LPL6_TRICU|nr:retrovirus-related Pol polyprotein from transposon 17.6 [Trichonephila clavata]